LLRQRPVETEFSRNWVTNIWSPAPASPAMTTAGSPGASRIRKKFKTMIASRTIAP